MNNTLLFFLSQFLNSSIVFFEDFFLFFDDILYKLNGCRINAEIVNEFINENFKKIFNILKGICKKNPLLLFIFVFFFTSFTCFIIALYAFITNRKDSLRSIIFLEFMFLNLSFMFAFFSVLFTSGFSISIAVSLLTISAIDGAIGIALILNVYTYRTDVEIENALYFRN